MRSVWICLALATTAAAADFHVDVGVYFGAPQQEVVVMRERRLPEYEIPVVLAAARQARVAPSAVVDLRLGGRSWTDIAVHFGLGPEVFYLPASPGGPPYGNAWGYWKKHRRPDSEFIEAVNTHFLTNYYHVPREEVLAYRQHGMSYVAIHEELGHGHGHPNGKGPDHDGPPGHQKEKHGNGHDHGKDE